MLQTTAYPFKTSFCGTGGGGYKKESYLFLLEKTHFEQKDKQAFDRFSLETGKMESNCKSFACSLNLNISKP